MYVHRDSTIGLGLLSSPQWHGAGRAFHKYIRLVLRQQSLGVRVPFSTADCYPPDNRHSLQRLLGIAYIRDEE
jgi:hypothetical protein